MPPERHRELSARGGVASGEKRRRDAEIREACKQAFLNACQLDGVIDSVEEYASWCKRQKKQDRQKKNPIAPDAIKLDKGVPKLITKNDWI